MSGGAKKSQTGQIIALAVLIAVAATLLWRAEGVTGRLGHLIGANNGDAAVEALLHQPNPTLHWGYLRAVRSLRYQGDLRNLFAPAPLAAGPRADPSGASAPSAAAAANAAANAGPPAPPPIPLKFYGYATRAGQSKRVFLRWNKNIYIARQGQIVANRYKILRIDPKAVAIQDLVEQRTEVVPLILPRNAG